MLGWCWYDFIDIGYETSYVRRITPAHQQNFGVCFGLPKALKVQSARTPRHIL